MFDDIEEFKEIDELYEKSRRLDAVLNEDHSAIESIPEYISVVGDKLDIRVLPAQTPMYQTQEEAKEASEKPELQTLSQFEVAVVKKYLTVE